MFKEQMTKIKKLLTPKEGEEEKLKDGKQNKRKIENLVVFLIILIVTLIAINAILSGNEKETQGKNENSNYKILAELPGKEKDAKEDELEQRLENILETMVGVRKSKSINYIHKIKWGNSNV